MFFAKPAIFAANSTVPEFYAQTFLNGLNVNGYNPEWGFYVGRSIGDIPNVGETTLVPSYRDYFSQIDPTLAQIASGESDCTTSPWVITSINSKIPDTLQDGKPQYLATRTTPDLRRQMRFGHIVLHNGVKPIARREVLLAAVAPEKKGPLEIFHSVESRRAHTEPQHQIVARADSQYHDELSEKSIEYNDTITGLSGQDLKTQLRPYLGLIHILHKAYNTLSLFNHVRDNQTERLRFTISVQYKDGSSQDFPLSLSQDTSNRISVSVNDEHSSHNFSVATRNNRRAMVRREQGSDHSFTLMSGWCAVIIKGEWSSQDVLKNQALAARPARLKWPTTIQFTAVRDAEAVAQGDGSIANFSPSLNRFRIGGHIAVSQTLPIRFDEEGFTQSGLQFIGTVAETQSSLAYAMQQPINYNY